MRLAPPSPLAGALLVLSLAATTAASQAPEPVAGSPEHAALAPLVARALAPDLSASARQHALDRLASAGAPVLPELLPILGEGRGPDGTRLTADQTADLAQVVGRIGHAVVVPYLEEVAHEATPPTGDDEHACRGALALLAPVARATDLRLALALAGASAPDASVPAPRIGPLTAALSGMLRNDRYAGDVLVHRALTLHSNAAPLIARAIGSAATPDSWHQLDLLLGFDTTLDGTVLAEIGRLADACPGTVPGALEARVSTYLQDPDTQLVRAAAETLGRLDAQSAHGLLIGLLKSPAPEIRRAALGALRNVTGLPLPEDAQRWQTWLDDEESWWRKGARELFQDLDRGDLSHSRAALQALSRHRLRRDVIAGEIAALLQRPSPVLRQEACRALGRLGAKAAVPVLRDVVAHADDETVVAAAQDALTTLGWRTESAPRADADQRGPVVALDHDVR